MYRFREVKLLGRSHRAPVGSAPGGRTASQDQLWISRQGPRFSPDTMAREKNEGLADTMVWYREENEGLADTMVWYREENQRKTRALREIHNRLILRRGATAGRGADGSTMGPARRYRVVHAPRVAVRSSPSTSGAIVGCRPFGQEFPVFEEAGGWVRVVQGVAAWSKCSLGGAPARLLRLLGHAWRRWAARHSQEEEGHWALHHRPGCSSVPPPKPPISRPLSTQASATRGCSWMAASSVSACY